MSGLLTATLGPTIGSTLRGIADKGAGGRRTVDNLPSPYVIAHRGGSLSGPEETTELYEKALGYGTNVLEGDIWSTSDDVYVLIHDSTVDRTTNGTGAVSSFTFADIKTLDSSYYATSAGWWSGVCRIISIGEMIAKFNNRCVYQIQPKSDDETGTLLDIFDAAGRKDQLIVETATKTVCSVAAARGYESQYVMYSDATVVDAQAAITAGATRLRVASDAPDATISDIVALGLPVVVGDVNRRWQYQRAIGLGCAGISTDAPGYVNRNVATRTTDTWRDGSLGNVTINNAYDSTGLSGYAISGGALKLPALGGNTVQYVIHGDMCPIAAASGSYSINVDVAFDTLPSDSAGNLGLHFCAADDTLWANTNKPYVLGYFARISSAGEMAIYRYNSPTNATQLKVKVSPALADGVIVPLVVSVTPSSITFTRSDTGDSITSSDTNYRGGYFHVGKTKAADVIGSISNLHVTTP